MIPQNHDPLKEALASDRLISQDVIFGKLAIWVLKIAAVGITGVFTWSLLSHSLPKDASSLMIAFAGVGAFMLEVCFLLATIWIRISRNGLQTALAWTIFGFSLLFLLINVVAGTIMSESKEATLGRGWLELYLVIMPATGVLCSVLVVLWSLASPEASTARRNSIASGLVSQRYEAARIRTALHDVSLNEVVDQAASRDAWNAVSRNLGLPAATHQGLPALPPALPAAQPAATVQPVYYYPQQPQQLYQQPQQQPGQPVTSASSNQAQAYQQHQHEQAYYPHSLSLVSTANPNPNPNQAAQPSPQQQQPAQPVPTAIHHAHAQPQNSSENSANTSNQPQSGAGLAGLLDLPGVRQLLATYTAKDKDKGDKPTPPPAHTQKPGASHSPAVGQGSQQHFAADSGPAAPHVANDTDSDSDEDSDANQGQGQSYPKNL